MSEYGGEEGCVNRFSSHAQSGELEFPYTYHFSPQPSETFSSFIHEKAKFSNEKRRLSQAYGKHKLFLPPLFQGRPLCFVSPSVVTRQKYEQLLQLFLEPAMMEKKRINSLSPIEAWRDPIANKKVFSRAIRFPYLCHENFRANLEVVYPWIHMPCPLFLKSVVEYITDIYMGDSSGLQYSVPEMYDFSSIWGAFLLAGLAAKSPTIVYETDVALVNCMNKMIKNLRPRDEERFLATTKEVKRQFDFVVGCINAYEDQFREPYYLTPDNYLKQNILPKIVDAYNKLKMEGYLLLCIDDTYNNPMAEKIMVYTTSIPNLIYVGTISSDHNAKSHYQCVHIWKKTKDVFLGTKNKEDFLLVYYPDLYLYLPRLPERSDNINKNNFMLLRRSRSETRSPTSVELSSTDKSANSPANLKVGNQPADAENSKNSYVILGNGVLNSVRPVNIIHRKSAPNIEYPSDRSRSSRLQNNMSDLFRSTSPESRPDTPDKISFDAVNLVTNLLRDLSDSSIMDKEENKSSLPSPEENKFVTKSPRLEKYN